MKTEKCGLCGEIFFIEVYCQIDKYGQEVTTVACKKCGLVQLNPRKNEDELANFYSSHYYTGYSLDENKAASSNWLSRKNKIAKDILDAVELHKELNGNKLLDIGSSYGFLIKDAKNRGSEVFGIEPSVKQANELQCEGFNIFNGTLQDYLDTDYNFFDIITLSHVLEHVEQPKIFLSNISKLLKPESFICVEVPNISWELEFGRFPYSTHSAHIYYFTPQTLEVLFKTSGYNVVSTSYGLGGATVRIIANLGERKDLDNFILPIHKPDKIRLDIEKNIKRLNPSLYTRLFVMPNLPSRIINRLKRFANGS